MTTGNRKTSNNRNRNKSNSNSRKRQTKKERMAEIEKTEAFRTEVILWIIVAVSLLLFISNMGFGGVVGPLAAVIIISLVWVGIDIPEVFDLREKGIQIFNAVVIAAVGLLMISNVKYYSFKTVDRRRVLPA